MPLETAAVPDDMETHTDVNPIRLAWGVILLAFTAFCVTLR